MYLYSGLSCASNESAKDLETMEEATSLVLEANTLLSEMTPAAMPEYQNVLKDSTSSLDTTTLMKDLEKVMAGLTLKDEPAGKEIDRATKLIQAYLFKNEPEFQRVMVYRDRGWNHNKEVGDKYFKEQRESADKVDGDGEEKFFKMMIRIGEEMDMASSALHPPTPAGSKIKVLDVCMAPGGYSAAVLKFHPAAEIFGVTLPKNEGGHPMILPLDKLRGMKYADVTMLASEMLKGIDKTIPKGFSDATKLISLRPFVSHKMDLVLLDGIVLRTHERASYRQQNEPLRLSTAQLVLGMQRIRQGGTLIMLMHKVDSWSSVELIYTISKFASVELFKPKTAHAARSSFYVIAKNVDIESSSAAAAMAEWRYKWFMATFGRQEGAGVKKIEPDEMLVLGILKTFGQKLVQMGKPIWRIQADALARTAYAGDVDNASEAARKKEA